MGCQTWCVCVCQLVTVKFGSPVYENLLLADISLAFFSETNSVTTKVSKDSLLLLSFRHRPLRPQPESRFWQQRVRERVRERKSARERVREREREREREIYFPKILGDRCCQHTSTRPDSCTTESKVITALALHNRSERGRCSKVGFQKLQAPQTACCFRVAPS